MISPSVNLGKKTENVKNAKSEMKKTQAKRRRIPRRGPGVAELEKILNDQQGGQDIPPPSPPPPRDYSAWSDLPALPNLGLVPPPLPTDIEMNFPSIYFPNFEFSASSMDRPYYGSMENFIRGCGSSAGRNYEEVEHPSSQRSADFNHTWTSPEEQQQMVNAKRPRGFLKEIHRDPNLQSRRVSIKEPSSSSLEINPTSINLNSNFRRDTKRGFLISCRSKNSGSYQLAEDRTNLMEPGSLSTSNQCASPFNFQETMEEEASQHGDEGGSVSYHNKSTFNSLYESNLKSKSKSKGRYEADAKVKGMAKAEVEEDGIDLDLKL